MTQTQALFAQLVPIVVLASVYVVHLYRTAKVRGPETDESHQVTRLRDELAAVKKERDSLKRKLRSLGQE